MKEKAIEKINKYGRIGKVIALILRILFIVTLVSVFVCSIFVMVQKREFMVMGITTSSEVTMDLSSWNVQMTDENRAEIEKQNENMNQGMNLNGVQYQMTSIEPTDNGVKLKSDETYYEISLQDVIPALIMANLLLISSIICLIYAGRLCNAFALCGSPFEEMVIKGMNQFAISLIPWAVLSPIASAVGNAIFTGNLTLAVSDFAVILVVLIIFALVQIFKYGAILQQESDETI